MGSKLQYRKDLDLKTQDLQYSLQIECPPALQSHVLMPDPFQLPQSFGTPFRILFKIGGMKITEKKE